MIKDRSISAGKPFVLGLALVFAALCTVGLFNRTFRPGDASRKQEDATVPFHYETPVSPVWSITDTVVDIPRRAHVAAQEGSIEDIDRLLREGFAVDGDIGRHQTMLMMTAKRGQLETARYLISQHADVSAVDMDGNSALSFAADYGFMATVDLLLKANPKQDIDALIGRRKVTLLIIAAQEGYLDLAEYMIRHHANVEAVDARGNTALMEAISFRHPDLVRYLIGCHANINAGKNGKNALYYALQNLRALKYPSQSSASLRIGITNLETQTDRIHAAEEIVAILKHAGAKTP